MPDSDTPPTETVPKSEKPIAITFEDLAEQRHLLQEFCALHVDSLQYFHRHLSFKVHPDEPDSEIGPGVVRHLTSSGTCYASILESERLQPDKVPADLRGNGANFADAAIALPTDRKSEQAGGPKEGWKSEGSARIYCRCRGLPFVASHMTRWHEKLTEHIGFIFQQLDFEEPNEEGGKRQAIGEADPTEDAKYWYPPNAYHTFWALETLDATEARFPEEFQKLKSDLKLESRRKQFYHWAEHKLTHEISLHSAKSSLLDSDQLAWSLAIFLRKPEHYESKLAKQDLIRQALKCLFDTQQDIGTWRHYGPLFHYQEAGNAYCYVFETFAWLLKQTFRPKAELIRLLLREYFRELMELLKYAMLTQTIIEENKVIAWSSGHRTNQLQPESWATASVFAYAQSLRRLVGIWTREEAFRSLNSRRCPELR